MINRPKQEEEEENEETHSHTHTDCLHISYLHEPKKMSTKLAIIAQPVVQYEMMHDHDRWCTYIIDFLKLYYVTNRFGVNTMMIRPAVLCALCINR